MKKMKLLIVDDEPLVQIGLKSMIQWEELGIELCGTASNGDSAWEMICRYRPEIVITDIRMPCSSGLELGKRCRQEMGGIPVFIILTSYEDFQYAREAMKFQAVDYLVKIDLSPENLTTAVKRAIEQVKLLENQKEASVDPGQNLDFFRERFYICLLNNLFESRKQILHQAEELQISFDSAGYAVANMEFVFHTQKEMTPEENLQIYNRTIQMFQELMTRYLPNRVVALDTKFLAVIFCVEEAHCRKWRSYVEEALKRTFAMLYNYYNVTFYTSVGKLVTDFVDISVSYYDARQIMGYVSEKSPMIFWEDFPERSSLRNVFNLYLFRNEISQAFEEMDAEALHDTFYNIIDLVSAENIHFLQVMDVASSILHLSINLLTDGDKIVSEIFNDEPDTYRSLYRIKTQELVIEWLKKLEQGLAQNFEESKKEPGNYLVEGCRQYIKEHIHEKITLQKLADIYEVSPNYLSQLFKKHMEIGLSEYITAQKIAESKTLLKETNLKIYEISDTLGFENSFYFSRVFKKQTGFSPKDYRNLR